MTISVMIIDDHPAVRLGLEALLNKFDDIEVIAVADGGEQALALCQQHQPDVALLDMYMPQMDGIATLKAIRSAYPTMQILMLTHSDKDETVIQALDAGALGYLLKKAEINAIADAIRAAASGRRTLSPEALEAIIRARTTPPPLPDTQLTERELDVLRLMVQGCKNTEIADELVVALSTVKFHISTIFKKLGVQSRTEAVITAVNRGLVPRIDD